MELVGGLKTYAWGKLGADSIVAKLAKFNVDNFAIDESTTYAELWMGTHVSGDCTVKSSGKALGSVLADGVPFLFKVLSVRVALSIQVHPNKADAERLHREHPEIYKDANHKPELAIALSPFKALIGFRPYMEIYEFFKILPPLRLLLGGEQNRDIERLKLGNACSLKNVYEKLMTSKQEEIENCIDEICKGYTEELHEFDLLDTFNQILKDFPRDVGVLSLFFLNMIQLKPGEAIFFRDGEIHAYLSGDCIECMASSDNVIRAGLTEKFKDVKELISLLNYEGLPPSSKLFRSRVIDRYAKLFAPPVEEFAVIQLNLPACLLVYKLDVKPVDSILLVMQGERTLRIKKGNQNQNQDLAIKRGSIIYIPPEAAPAIKFFVNNRKTDKFVAYLATANTRTA